VVPPNLPLRPTRHRAAGVAACTFFVCGAARPNGRLGGLNLLRRHGPPPSPVVNIVRRGCREPCVLAAWRRLRAHG